MSTPRISAVVAAAGAGKTTLIVHGIAEAVKTLPPEEIVATTFTVKAANELIERTRACLVQAGQLDTAARLLGARFGTVNAICGQIAAEYALDLGRSPSTEVIPEEQMPWVFAIAAAGAIARHAPVLHPLGTAFGFDEPAPSGDSPDWRDTVRHLVELARANGIGPETVARSANRSVESFLALLPLAPAGTSAASLDADLSQAIVAAVAAIPNACSAKAGNAIEALRQAQAATAAGEHPSWPAWARLSKVSCAKKDGSAFVDALQAVKRAAAQHPIHPRVRAQCEGFIRALFSCAAEALQGYQDYKAERGLLDFVDQETLALAVLHTPALAARLGEHVGRVFVDEFQDSSPLQIAIFAALAQVAEASTWVGDPKQAIYGFRNADTTLTQAAFEGVIKESDAPHVVLSRSYRSRQGIVDLVNAAFAPSLTAMGLAPAQHAFSGTSRPDEAFTQPPSAVWWLGGNKQERAEALAGGVRDVLAAGDDWLVDDRAGGARPARAGDIAVLCRSNSEVAGIAAALSRLGIAVAVARAGLAGTPHVQVVIAAVRWTIDPSDRLALAEMARFFAEDAESDLWLQAVSTAEPDMALGAAVPITEALTALRGQLLALTPAELIDAVISLPEVLALIARWGDLAMRLDDLEALRGAVRIYETACTSSGAPATPSGFVLGLAAAEPMRPKSLQLDAVSVLTYHGAKGLEWPIVILGGLDSGPRPRHFEQPVAEAEGVLDWRNPLAGRWIRYWPWPYGSQQKQVGLDDAAHSTALGIAAVRRAREEDARLLYVGVTRARDYVVFAPSAGKPDPLWLQVLDGPEQPRHLILPAGAEPVIHVAEITFPARLWQLSAAGAAGPTPAGRPFVNIERAAVARLPLRRRPSDERGEDHFVVVARIALGARLQKIGDPDMTMLGTAVHAVLAADRDAWPLEQRMAQAGAILARWGVHEIRARDVIEAADRLNTTVRALWPLARIRREVPIQARLGTQLVSGRIDLLLEDSDGFVVIDHKTFPGSRDQWESHAVQHGAQLSIYAQAVTAATGRPCERLYVHMPIGGILLRVAPHQS